MLPDIKTFDRKQFMAGELILQEGTIGTRAYLVETGAVEISRGHGEKRRVLGRVGPGGIFGELALIDGGNRSADARATAETVCLVIPEAIFKEKLEKADPFLRALIRIMCRNLRNMTQAGVDTELIKTALLERRGADRVLPFRYVAAARACPKPPAIA